MTTNLLPLISFVLISTFTPGPSNISSASLSVLHGYRNTLKYQAGLAVGVFLLMFLSGWLSAALLNIFPALEPILRIVGAAYILYLAFKLLKASYSFEEKDSKPAGFAHGFILQILNPKLMVYAFTLFSAFLAPLARDMTSLLSIIAVVTAISFCATSVWALFGTAIRNSLHNPRLRMLINIVLALSLVYVAISLTGIL